MAGSRIYLTRLIPVALLRPLPPVSYMELKVTTLLRASLKYLIVIIISISNISCCSNSSSNVKSGLTT